MEPNTKLNSLIKEHLDLFVKVESISPEINSASRLIIDALKSQRKILICGNGGSASDSQHLAAEFIGRFEKDREALAAIALTTDTSILSALGNDYGYDLIFAKQVAGLGIEGDVLIGISTSGNSKNVIQAVKAAKQKNLKTIGLLGGNGGKLKSEVDIPVIVPHNRTARIQEVHLFIYHYWALQAEDKLF